MAVLLECVPNFSEGRRPAVVAAIVDAVAAVAEVRVLDETADASHNRSVVTFAGRPEAVAAAAGEAFRVAVERIDMRAHSGVHPRIGAVDVVPFVPLGHTSMSEAVETARRVAEVVAARHGVPAYLYGEAALRPERVRLANVRRGGYEGLRSLIATDPARAPDFGPRQMHPTAGAVAVGARAPLIAFNLNLRTDDVAVARRIAVAIRESSGGLPAVQAMGVGVRVADRAAAQVSTNLVDWRQTGIADVVAEVRRLARAAGTELDACELIGLVPAEAIRGVEGAAFGIPDLADRTIEARLERGAR